MHMWSMTTKYVDTKDMQNAANAFIQTDGV